MGKFSTFIATFIAFIILCPRLLIADDLKLTLEKIDVSSNEEDWIRSKIKDFDPVLFKVIAKTDKYLGIKTRNELGNYGFRLYDKDLNLLWDKKPRSFEDEQKYKIAPDEHLLFCDVAISENAEIVVLKLGSESDLGGYWGAEIYVKTLFGYKMTRKINFSSSKCLVEIDEKRERIYIAGFFPNRKESKDLKVVCLTKSGKPIWDRIVPLAANDEEINVSSDFTIQFVYGIYQPFTGKGAILIDSSGNIIGNITERGGCFADLSKDGKLSLFAGQRKIYVYSNHPYAELQTVELERKPEWEIFFIKDVAISPDNEMLAALCQVDSHSGSESRLFLFDITGMKLLEKSTLDWGDIMPRRIEFESERVIRLDKTWKVAIEN